MHAPATRSDTPQRSEGRVSLTASRIGGTTRVARLAEAGALRLRLPRTRTSALEVVLINTAGGVAGGDRHRIEIDVQPGAHVVVATPAAEKVYRSEDAEAEIEVHLAAAPGAHLEWLPQETILFDRARLRRRIEADIAPDAGALLLDALVFGRVTRGEIMTGGLLADRWRIRRGGRLVYADAMHLAPLDAALLERPSTFNGQRAAATLLLVAPNAEQRLDAARALLQAATGEAAAGAWNGMLAIRFLAAEIAVLRRDCMRFLAAFRGALPRVWQM